MTTHNSLQVEVRIVEVKILDDYAYDRATFTMSMKPKAGGKTEEMGGRVFEVLRKEGGKWKSLRVMVNSDK
jgi:ketosteroid isomerase-like protein